MRYLSERPEGRRPELLVGLHTPDDAAVYQLNDEQAVVLTTDFFAPLVDDPYAYGAIAAANAMSDVYAMGGEVVLALNVAAFPEDMAAGTIAAVLRGGADKVSEAGGVIAGGHTIIDAEPKFGLCVLGLVHPNEVLIKGGALPDDLLYLTKPLGTGIVTTAAMRDEAAPAHLQGAIDSMTQLNRHASHIVREIGAHALTDVTGFGILGHGYEMATASGLALQFVATAMPVLDGALEYAGRGTVTGGAERNRRYLDGKVRLGNGISHELEHVLFDPQTSGGLLFAIARELASDVEARFEASVLPVWRVGEAVNGTGVEVTA